MRKLVITLFTLFMLSTVVIAGGLVGYITAGSTGQENVVPVPLPGFKNPPADLDKDGLYEDINGDGRKNFSDVVGLFKYLEWVGSHQPCIKCFDFNRNGRVDFDDVVRLFKLPSTPPTTTTTTATTPTVTPTIIYGKKYLVKVLDVVDGDTMDVLFNGKRVRFLGVDTPEKLAEDNKPYEYDSITDLQCLANWGMKAKEFTGKLEGEYVYIEFDELAGLRGYYGRLLAYVYLQNGTDFTAELVKKGYARAYTEGEFKKEQEYVGYQEQAMAERLGLWSCMPAPTITATTPTPTTTPTTTTTPNCDPSYPDVCIPPPPPDLDCKDIPYRNFRVLPPDPHHFDRDGDGIGCES